MTLALEYLNLVFIWIFTLEMLVKMLSIGVIAYFKAGFNVFDFLIVVLRYLSL